MSATDPEAAPLRQNDAFSTIAPFSAPEGYRVIKSSEIPAQHRLSSALDTR